MSGMWAIERAAALLCCCLLATCCNAASAANTSSAPAVQAALRAGSLGIGFSGTGFLFPTYFVGVLEVLRRIRVAKEGTKAGHWPWLTAACSLAWRAQARSLCCCPSL